MKSNINSQDFAEGYNKGFAEGTTIMLLPAIFIFIAMIIFIFI